MNSYLPNIIFFIILAVLLILYNRFEDKRKREESRDNYESIQKYLLDGDTLAKSKKPILWIHVPYEYNSRRWLDFGSRNSFELNQPYLYLTVKSIIHQCDKSFTICIIDDNTFKKLIPGWSVDMTTISNPILENMRQLALMKLLHTYGGLICPISFVCIRDLIEMYDKGTRGDKMFLCETNDKNITSATNNYYPSLSFCGAPKDCNTVMKLIDFIQRTMSRDYTAETEFLGNYDRWANSKIKSGEINLINGLEIGVKTIDEEPIRIEHLMSNNYLKLYKGVFGILIPADEILKRRHFEWFSRLSGKKVLESNTIIGNYLLVNIAEGGNILDPFSPIVNKEIKKEFVGFYKTPNYPSLYGLKPNFLGDNLLKS
jgi:hypothetical protein